MLFYSHPLAKNNSYIKLDKSLTARDKDYEQLEMKLNESRIIDILSQRLSIEMREIIETLSKDKKLSDEILEDYRSKFFTYHRHVLTAAELPKLITDDNGNLIRDIEEHIYEMEEKIHRAFGTKEIKKVNLLIMVSIFKIILISKSAFNNID